MLMKCNFDPMIYKDQPIGQFHCPECSVMVIAGLDHPEICDCSGYADYKLICDKCNHGWQNHY